MSGPEGTFLIFGTCLSMLQRKKERENIKADQVCEIHGTGNVIPPIEHPKLIF